MPERTSGGWHGGVSNALPIVLGYLPVGLAYGVLASEAGLSPLNTLLMSLLVYAGASQFIAVGLLAGGAWPLSIVVTTLVVNLRHFLFSSALASHLEGWRPWQRAAWAYQLTDETFAVHAAQFSAGECAPGQALALNASAQAAWVLGTGLGIVAGQRVGDVRALGLDFALPALFIALLFSQIRDRVQVWVALLAGAVSTTLLLAGWERWHVMVAAVAAAGVGALLRP